MRAFIRRALVVVLIAVGLYWYAENYGIYLGYPPFTPVFLWNYTGERVYEVTLRGSGESIKVKVRGELKEGSLRVQIERGGEVLARTKPLTGAFSLAFKHKLQPGRYTLRFLFQRAKGWVRLDWVSTKFQGW